MRTANQHTPSDHPTGLGNQLPGGSKLPGGSLRSGDSLLSPRNSTGKILPGQSNLPRDWMTVSGDLDDFIFYEGCDAPSQR